MWRLDLPPPQDAHRGDVCVLRHYQHPISPFWSFQQVPTAALGPTGPRLLASLYTWPLTVISSGWPASSPCNSDDAYVGTRGECSLWVLAAQPTEIKPPAIKHADATVKDAFFNSSFMIFPLFYFYSYTAPASLIMLAQYHYRPQY